MAAYANLNAVDFFERAIAFWAMLDPAEAVRTQLELADVWDRLGERDKALSELTRAEHDAERSEVRDELVAEILLKRAPIEARGESEGCLDRARRLAHKAREMAIGLQRPQLQATAAANLAYILGEYDSDETSRKAIYYAEQALAIRRDRGDVASSLWRLANGFLRRNDLGRASSLYEQAVELAEAAQNDILLGACLINTSLVSFRRWDLDEAIVQAERALAINRRIGDRRRIS